jgi:hypothetical protein
MLPTPDAVEACALPSTTPVDILVDYLKKTPADNLNTRAPSNLALF